MKKLFSILVALIICLSPVLLLTGCGETDRGVVFPDAIKSGWEFYVGDSFSDARTIPGSASSDELVQIKYKSEKFDPAANNGKGGMVEKEEGIKIRDAFSQGMLICISGLDTSTVTEAGKPRTMILMFDGETVEVTYTVKAAPITT